MKKLVALVSIFVLISGCGRKYSRDSSGSSNTGSGSGDSEPNKVEVNISRLYSAADDKKFTELILDLKCPKSLPGDNDWIENNVKVTDVKPTFNLIKGVACTITLKSYKDSTQTFSPNDNNSPLILSISSGGIGTLTEASKYTRVPSDGLTWYFAANTTEAYKVVLNYGKDPDNVTSEIQNKEPIEVEVIAGQGAIPPSVTGLLITKTPNNTGITDFSIFGTVANSTGCKLFKISELKTFDYKSVNSAYNGSSGTECPDFKGTQGNWTKYAAEGRIIVWLNMISGTQFNGYTYIQIDKDPK